MYCKAAGKKVAIILPKIIVDFRLYFDFSQSTCFNTVNEKMATIYLPAFPVNLNQPRSLCRSHA